MISAKRIVEIFSRRGGGGEISHLAISLSPEQFAYLRGVTEGEPIVAKVSSRDEWFVLTKSLAVFKSNREMRRIPFDQIVTVSVPHADMLNERIKIAGGNLDIGLRDGTTHRVRVQPGGPYIGVMNVLMRFAKINHRQRLRDGDHGVSPTTRDQRPTTQL